MIEVVTHIENGEEVVDTWDGPQATWVTEPSGALVVMQTKTIIWAAYGPGFWRKVRDIDVTNEDG